MPTDPAQKDTAASFLEKQLEESAPNLDADLRRTLASLGAAITTQKANVNTEQKAKQSAKFYQLPLWREPTRGTPNSFWGGVRS